MVLMKSSIELFSEYSVVVHLSHHFASVSLIVTKTIWNPWSTMKINIITYDWFPSDMDYHTYSPNWEVTNLGKQQDNVPSNGYPLQ